MSQTYNNPISAAIERAERYEVIKCITEKHITLINSQDKIGRTPLHFAVNKENLEVMKMLLANGADANIKTNQYSTVLHFCIDIEDIEFAKLVIEQMDEQNIDGDTVLILASICNNVPMVELLLKNDANVNIKNIHNKNALDYAKELCHKDIIKLLENHLPYVVCFSNGFILCRRNLIDEKGNVLYKIEPHICLNNAFNCDFDLFENSMILYENPPRLIHKGKNFTSIN